MKKDSRIFIAGHRGLVGSAIKRKLESLGYTNIITRSKSELDLRDQAETKKFFLTERPEYVFLAAAKVGGIGWNAVCPADFIYDNLQIQNNVIDSSYRSGVKKLLFLGSACIYPKITDQPIKEEYLMSSYLEPTNEGYALAKIAGLKMCQFYNKQYGFNAISLMPANLYGLNDNFNVDHCHVIPALIRKFNDAKNNGDSTVTCFGDGTPRREFLHVDDLADACVFLMNTYNSPEHINIGSDSDISIKDLAYMIKDVVGFDGDITWDTDKPNGTPVRKLDITKLESLGWKSTMDLKQGIEETYKWFTDSTNNIRL
jgi:GDP-L-fucose synthase